MRLFIIVEGETEELFVTDVLRPYFWTHNFYNLAPIIIQTSSVQKGGFVNYQHLKNSIINILHEPDTVVTTLVDYFGMPTNLPNYANCQALNSVSQRIECLEASMKSDIGFGDRFIPYIQQHEFEALLFASNRGFISYFGEKIGDAMGNIMAQYDNPEEINDSPQTAPSKRILSMIPSYKKVNDGNLIALEIGLQTIMDKCPRFRIWIERLTALVLD
jgi:Domain of unknown function (DUF4276)